MSISVVRITRSTIALEFEWDDEKAEANWRTHGIAFQEAIKAFTDPFGVERIDEREDYGEERIQLVGMCEGVLIHAADHRMSGVG